MSVRMCPSEKVTFDQRFEEGEGISHVDIWGKYARQRKEPLHAIRKPGWLVQGEQRKSRWPRPRMDGTTAGAGLEGHCKDLEFYSQYNGSYCRTANRVIMTSSDTFLLDQLLLCRP